MFANDKFYVNLKQKIIKLNLKQEHIYIVKLKSKKDVTKIYKTEAIKLCKSRIAFYDL